MPSRRALAFIMSAKPAIEPPTPSAIATAMSLADFTISILSALSTVTLVPTLKPILVGCCAAALRDTGEQGVERDAAFLDRAQRRVGGHQLGDRGRIPRIGGVLGVQHLAGRGLDQQLRFGLRRDAVAASASAAAAKPGP